MKKAHKLRRNKRNLMYNKLIFFDTETTNYKVSPTETHAVFKLAVICIVDLTDDNEPIYKTVSTVKRFWEIIEENLDKQTLVFAHNMHFDLNVVEGLKRLPALGFEIQFPVFESSVFILSCIKNNKRVVFLDTFNYFKTSLERIGKLLNLPKYNIDFENTDFRTLADYCKRDVEIIKEVILQWMDFIIDNDFGNMQFTIASQSFTAYRHRFMDTEIFIHNNPEAINLEQKSYRGGRTEAFQIGEIGLASLVDINSLYPFVMKHFEYPCKLLSVKDNILVKDINYLLKQGYALVADCLIETTEPVIGIKRKVGDNYKLIFPVGQFNATITTPEIRYLLNYQKIHKVRKIAIYEKEYIFTKFVDELFERRKEYLSKNNHVFEQMVKLILNSLYGKFGQKQKRLICIGEAPSNMVLSERCYNVDTGKHYTQLVFGGKVWINETTDEESFNSFTAIASHVTAYARLYLYLLSKIPDTIFYCDTDSYIIRSNALGSFGYLLGKELGQLKVEEHEKDCFIFNAKDYLLGKLRKKKGIKKNAIRLAQDTFQQEHFMKTKSLIRKGLADRVIINSVIKECKSHYDKGIVEESGKVLPLFIHER